MIRRIWPLPASYSSFRDINLLWPFQGPRKHTHQHTHSLPPITTKDINPTLTTLDLLFLALPSFQYNLACRRINFLGKHIDINTFFYTLTHYTLTPFHLLRRCDVPTS